MKRVSSGSISIFEFNLRQVLGKAKIWTFFALVLSLSLIFILFFDLGFSREFIILSIFTLILALEAVYDISFKEVQLGLILIAVGLRLGEFFIFWDYEILKNILLGIVVCAIIILIARFTKGGIGEGDALIFLLINSYLGPRYSFVILFVALFVLIAFSVPLIIAKSLNTKSSLPFVPFLYVAYFLFLIGIKI